jgi:hypothetical protein
VLKRLIYVPLDRELAIEYSIEALLGVEAGVLGGTRGCEGTEVALGQPHHLSGLGSPRYLIFAGTARRFAVPAYA